jgi:hypothetical protein
MAAKRSSFRSSGDCCRFSKNKTVTVFLYYYPLPGKNKKQMSQMSQMSQPIDFIEKSGVTFRENKCHKRHNLLMLLTKWR